MGGLVNPIHAVLKKEGRKQGHGQTNRLQSHDPHTAVLQKPVHTLVMDSECLSRIFLLHIVAKMEIFLRCNLKGPQGSQTTCLIERYIGSVTTPYYNSTVKM